MNTFDSVPSIFVVDDSNDVLNPAYPMPPGGGIPDLNLAGWPNQQGDSIQVMPDPGKPPPMEYTLVGDPCMGGYEPSNSTRPAPNLAGIDGTPLVTPGDALDRSGNSPMQIVQPDYIEPDWSSLHPNVQPFNLVAPGIHLDVAAEYAPDPMHPNLTSYNRPVGLNIHNLTGNTTDLWKPDPVLADLLQPDLPDGIQVMHQFDQPDPLVPDLQQPQLTPNVVMQTRPGELAPNAIPTLHASPTYKDQSDVPYGNSFMDQNGMNTRRRRHMDILMHGLDSEER